MGAEAILRPEGAKGRRVNILYQSSDAYAPVMGVSITSLFENNQHIPEMKVYILDGGICDKNKSLLRILEERYHRQLQFLDGKTIDGKLEQKGIRKWRNAYAVYYKLFAIDQIDDDIDRLLAIDADTIVNKPIDSLYFTELDGNVVGMVQDIMPASYMRKIGMKRDEVYYNTGMVLFDVRRWKSQKCVEDIEQFLTGDLQKILYADQDALSIVLQKKTKKLPLKYNYFSIFPALRECLSFDIQTIYKIYSLGDLFEYYSPQENLAVENEAVIYHYEGGTVVGRPWEEGEEYSVFRLWAKYKEFSPWRDMGKLSSQETWFHRTEKKMKQYLPFSLFLFFYRVAYAFYWKTILLTKPNN